MMNIAKMIDHTLLKADATKDQIEKLCSEAREYQFASVCVNPVWVKEAAQALKGSTVEVCTVIGFPLGATTTETKAFEAKNAIENGATEVDMVINIGALKNNDLMTVEEDIRAVVQAAKGKAITKVIIETCLLTENQKVSACQLAVKAGAEFVKTSTGFSTGGAKVEDVALMRSTVGPEIGVKASGGIRSLTDMEKMIEAGATRVGASAGVQIMKELVMK
jgi:deoxyribose-phosphate aldolase